MRARKSWIREARWRSRVFPNQTIRIFKGFYT
jgi:hypothetical protein